MTPPPTILTVCAGNICRSPTAEAALREAAARAAVAIKVRSAGTGSWHVGAPPDARMRAAAVEVGLDLDGEAARVSASDLDDADLVVAMDRANLADLERLAAAAGVDTPIILFRDLDPEAGPGAEVPDPYYGGQEGFTEVVTLCRRTADHLVAALANGGIDAVLAARERT